jgi:hypothetical protein
MSWHDFVAAVASPRVIAAYRLSFGASLAAGFVNMVFGLIVAWVLVRYSFPGKRIVDALVDLPFALPTAVAGIALTSLYAPNGWVGRWLAPLRPQGRLHLDGRLRGADLHRPAVRREDGAARAPGAGARDRGGVVDPRGEPLADRRPGSCCPSSCRRS